MRLLKIISLSITTLFLCQPLLAQERVWRVGIHAGTGYYQLYNKNDWNADPLTIYPVKSQPTNWTIGATTTYTWGVHWGLSSGLLISNNKQEFRALTSPLVPDPNESYSIKNEFNYLKLPLIFHFSTDNQAKHQFRFSTGIQTSFLMNYTERFLQTGTDFRSESETRNKKVTGITPNNGNATYNEFLYNRLLIGSFAELSYCFKTSENWLLAFGIRGEYDFTNAENHDARVVENGLLKWVSSLKRAVDNNIADRPKTLNRSVGFCLSASIPVDIH